MAKYSWMALTSSILVIIGLILDIYYLVAFAIIVMILATIFGIAGLMSIKRDKKLKGKILAWMGTILGILFTIIISLLPKS